MSPTPELSVVIVSWNARDVLANCLRSLQVHPPSLPWEVVVVDNGSRDGTVAHLRAEHPWVRIVANRTNRGLPAANNQGMVAARGTLLLICNPDVVFTPGAIDALVAALERHPEAGWVVPRLRHPDGRLQTSAGELPSLLQALAGRQLNGRRPGGFWWDGWAHDEERAIGRGHEAAYVVRRAAVVDVGLQDEAYVLDWEGFDWTDRFHRRGWQVWLAPAAEVVHLGGTSIRQVPLRWVISQHRGMYRYFASRRRATWRPLLAALFTVRAAVKLAASAGGAAMYQRAHEAASRTRTGER